MAKETKKSSSTPLIIIGLVLVAAVVGFYMLYSTSKSPAANNSAGNGRPSNANRPSTVPANAPAGAALGINMLGAPDAKVTIEEFADFQCPSCAAAHPVMKDLQSTFAGNNNVRFIFRHYPLPIHDKSYDAAAVVEAAGMQGGPKFWAMMDQIMANQQTWANSTDYRNLWKSYAQKIGLDVAKWEADSASVAAKGRVDLDMQRARGVGVSSTPSVYINGRLIPFSDVNVPTMKQLIETEIETVTKAGAAANSANAAPAANANANSAK